MGPRAREIHLDVEAICREQADYGLALESGARLEAGAALYGDWEPGRNWAEEASQEALDGVHYCLAGAMHDPDRAGTYRALAERFADIWTALQGVGKCQP